MKYIYLSFKSAAVCFSKMSFGKPDVKDYVSDLFTCKQGKSYINRAEHPYAKDSVLAMNDETLFDKPLFGYEQVSNMLHVLCGCRPVPSRRESLQKRLPLIDEIAKNVWCRIDNALYWTTKDGQKRPICEFTQARKFHPNTGRDQSIMTEVKNSVPLKGAHFTWDKLKKRYYYTDRKSYDLLLDQLVNWYGKKTIKEDFALVDLLRYLSFEKGLKNEMLRFFNENGFLKIFSDVVSGENKSLFNKVRDHSNDNFTLQRLVLIIGELYKLRIDGEFIVPIQDERVYEAIINGVRTCTFLEGGCVTIKKITDYIDEDDVEEEGFKQIFIS